MKYLKWIYGTRSNNNLEYKIDKINIAEKWNPTSND